MNGISLRQGKGPGTKNGAIIDNSSNKILKRNQEPIANIYFKFAHTDEPGAMNGNMATKITNHYQTLVVNELTATIAKLKAVVDAV